MIMFNYIRDKWNTYQYNKEKKAYLNWLLLGFKEYDKKEGFFGLISTNRLSNPFNLLKTFDAIEFYMDFWEENKIYLRSNFNEWMIECIERELAEM